MSVRRVRFRHHTALARVSVLAMACSGGGNPETIQSGQSCNYEPGLTISISGAETRLGDNAAYPKEKERNARFGDFGIDAYEVTNAAFAAFVEDIGYVTTAERLT